jgi:hypothetical protein
MPSVPGAPSPALNVEFTNTTPLAPRTVPAMLLAPAVVALPDSNAKSRISSAVTPSTTNAVCAPAGFTCVRTTPGA